MGVLEQKKTPYTAHTYPIGDAAPDGVSAAKMSEFEAAAALRDQIIKLRGEGK